MGLQAFVRRPDVRAKLRALRPNCPRKVRGLYKLEPGTSHRVLVNTAFDYFLGLEIKRLAPYSVVGKLGIQKKLELLQQNPVRLSSEKHLYAEISDYTVRSNVNEEIRKDAARLALKLAKFEFASVFEDPKRALEYQADQRDVLDLVAMLDVAPVESFAANPPILLWPELPHATPYVHAADVDFIINDRIVEVTTTYSTTLHNYVLDELIGQLFLALKEHELDPSFPVVTRASLYYARYGYTLTLNAEDLIQHDSFDELYNWFFDTAAQTYHYSPPTKHEAKDQAKPSKTTWWEWLSSWWSHKKS